jgi:hypothetical protein
MPSLPSLSRLSIEDREQYLWRVFQEAESFKSQKEAQILKVFRYIRGLRDPHTVYRKDFRHPYAFAAAESQKAVVAPVLFSADPMVQLVDPNQENQPRNQVSERLITATLSNPQVSNFPPGYLKTINDVVWFGFSHPWTYFRSESQKIGPRFVPRTLPDGSPVLDSRGNVVQDMEFEDHRIYHAPWLEHTDVWDSFLHPDGIRGFTRRDSTGYSLEAQSQGANPIYDPVRVRRMFLMEMSRSVKSMAEQGSFHRGTESMVDRDQMAAEVGVEPLRHDEILQSDWSKDVKARPYVLLHYDDGRHHGTYAVHSKGREGGVGLMELRFFEGINYDGTSNRLQINAHESPQEIYGTSIIEWTLPLLDLQSEFYRAAADGAALSVHNPFLVSSLFDQSGGNLVLGPGAKIKVPQTLSGNLEEHVKPLSLPQGWFNSIQFADNIKNSMDSVWGQGEAVRGRAAGGRTTAREASIVAANSTARTEMLVKNVFNQFAAPYIRKVLSMISEHWTARDYVKILGPEGVNYIPPSRQEIIGSLQYVPQGSLTAADSELRAARWPAVFQTLVQVLPYMQLPWMHEAVKRSLEDQGLDGVSRLIPSLQDPQMSEYMAMVQAAQQQQGGQPGQASPPRSPGDISGMLSQIGGAGAPPGPVDGGGVSAASNGGQRF